MAAFARFHVPVPQRERHFREIDPLSLDFTDEELMARYRFGRESINFITALLKDDLERKTGRNHALSVEKQVLITLRYLASGSFLQVIGDTLGIDKSTVSRTVHAVSEALCSRKDHFIKWPSNDDAQAEKVKFYRLGRFPGVIGAIDGTHVRIQAPQKDEPSYVNRKGFHSINVQVVCNAEGKMLNVNASWPGSAHDAHIFRTSQVCSHLERVRNWERGILLGDSGYPCRPFLMTPYLNPQGESQMRYNRSHATTRSIIERTFGRWKRRFHILHSEIRLKPERVCKIIIACAVLHNISLMMQEPLLDDDCCEQILEGDTSAAFNGPQDGRGIRNHLTQTFFN